MVDHSPVVCAVDDLEHFCYTADTLTVRRHLSRALRQREAVKITADCTSAIGGCQNNQPAADGVITRLGGADLELLASKQLKPREGAPIWLLLAQLLSNLLRFVCGWAFLLTGLKSE